MAQRKRKGEQAQQSFSGKAEMERLMGTAARVGRQVNSIDQSGQAEKFVEPETVPPPWFATRLLQEL
jgi:hypothetical protein